MSEYLVEVKDLKKQFVASKSIFKNKSTYVNAVNGITLNIKRGETLGLVGESGCGKSTLGRTILRLTPATSGQVIFDGQDIGKLSNEDMRQMRKRMQMIFQDPYSCLNPRMNVLELVRAPLDVFKIGTREERVEKVKEMLEIVGMGEQHMMRYPHEFSGGQRQRVGIARALISNPEFVVCDEPVSALDVSVRASVLNLMNQLQERLCIWAVLWRLLQKMSFTRIRFILIQRHCFLQSLFRIRPEKQHRRFLRETFRVLIIRRPAAGSIPDVSTAQPGAKKRRLS